VQACSVICMCIAQGAGTQPDLLHCCELRLQTSAVAATSIPSTTTLDGCEVPHGQHLTISLVNHFCRSHMLSAHATARRHIKFMCSTHYVLPATAFS
jgi:hypothetical protein